MINKKPKDIISYHKNWILNGYSFEDIITIQGKLKDEDPFMYAGTSQIQEHIGGQVHPQVKILEDSDYTKIKYIVIENIDFNGNINFLERCINIEQLNISGVCCEGKIKDILVLENFTNLKYIDFHSHSISDISPLSKLDNLETLILWGNPIKYIKPIIHLKNLKNVQFSVVEEDEVFELLRNSQDARVKYVSAENDESYKAVRINDWAFRTKSYKDLTSISVIVEPLIISTFKEKLKTCSIDYIPLMRQKSENIVKSLLSDNHEFISSKEYFHEEVKLLKVFEYKLK